MTKIRKFDVVTVPLEVEYLNPILGRLFAVAAWFMLIRFKKFNLSVLGKNQYSFYRLIVPRFLEGGGDNEK